MNGNQAWRRWSSRSLGVNAAIVIFNAILIGVLWNVVIGLVQRERQITMLAAIDRNDNLAVAFEQYTTRTIESANAVIQQLIRAYVSSGRTMGLEQFVADFTIDNKAIIGVVLADEHGNGKTSAYLGSAVKPINVADREHFRVHIEHDSGKVFVGKPVVGRVTGQWVVPVTRRINKADGTFGGVAMALIEPARFTDVLHDAKMRPLDIISLVGLDGIIRAKLTGATASTGQDISKSPLFAEQTKRPVGNFFANGQLDSVPRFFSYRTLPDYQVMAIVGTAGSDVMAEFNRRQRQYLWAAGLTSVVIAGFAVLLMLALARQRRAAINIARSQARFLATFNQAAVGIAHSDLNGRYLAVNQKFCEILGYSREALLARTVADVTHPDDIQSVTDFCGQRRAEHGEVEFLEQEKRYIRKDGAIVWCAITMSFVRDKTGKVDYVLVVIQDISDRKRANIRIEYLNRVYAVLSGINTLIVRVGDRNELFREACAIAVGKGQFPFAWIGVLDPATQDVTPVAWAGDGAAELTRAKSSARGDIQEGKGAVGRAIRERRPVFNNDITVNSFGGPRLQEILKLGFRSQITLPLFEGKAVIGTLTMYTGEPDFFDEDELALLTELAGDISFAIENISRQQKLEKLSRVRAMSGAINAAILRIREREGLLRETCRIAVEHGKFGMVWIALLDQEKQRIQPIAWTGFSSEIAHDLTWAHLNMPGATLAEVIRTRRVAVRNDIDAETPVGTLRQEAMKKRYRSTVCVPFMVDDRVVAAIILFAPGAGFFDNEELALLNEVAADVSFALQAIEKQQKLEYLSYYDVLTGLANRTLFLERVAPYMRSAASVGHKLALFLIDLERFRNINESLGRPAGDALLRQVAEWLCGNVGDANLLARVGADHFAVVLPEIKQEGNVVRLLEKTMAAFLEHPFRLNDGVFRIAIKVGVALFPDDGANADALYRNAEAALKKAKSSGERYLFYTQSMNERVAGKLTLENQLRQALDNEEFVLHYQPKMNLVSGKVTGAEALIRWNDPRTGLVPPGQFIPILEETGLIYDVGRWAVKHAIKEHLRWRTAGLPAVRIAVNVSPLQLRSRGFVAEIRQAIGIDAHAASGLELEITESLIMEDVKHNIATLAAIRAMGVTIAIDDFGTGFSSLSYLARLPVDTLKIDRSFVTDMTGAPEGLALVSTIINLAHSLKLKVVAEGVETEEQSRLLRLLRCDEAQGYLFSKPVPAEIFETSFLAPAAAGMTIPTKILIAENSLSAFSK